MRLKIVISALSIFVLVLLNGQDTPTIFIHDDIQLVPLNDSVYIHISWFNSEQYGRFSSNGLLVIKNSTALLVDTPMENETTKVLYEFVRDSLHAEIAQFVAGHFHRDCMGGLPYLKSKGVKTIATEMTMNKRKELGYPLPDFSFKDSLQLVFEGMPIECRYFGGAHSFDNITVWLPDQKILFGGCMVKNIRSKNLGNLSDAVTNEWDTTVGKVLEAYPDARTVIPGHGPYRDTTLLTHTINLVRDFNNTKH